MRGAFITGTDTGVGKSIVAAAVLAALRGDGVDAVPMKPVQTGCARAGAGLVAPDLELALRVGGLNPTTAEREWMCPYRFEPACSPHLAAERASAPISLERIEACFAQLAQRHEAVIVEGAGGTLVPLVGEKTMLDLMLALQLPVLLIARPGLGTINHTLLTLSELRRAGLTVCAVVFNESSDSTRGFIEEDNQRAIARLSGAPVIGPLTFLCEVEDSPEQGAALLRAWHELVPDTRALLEQA